MQDSSMALEEAEGWVDPIETSGVPGPLDDADP